MTTTRRLAAILAADVAGYSRLMGVDEEGTLERLKALRAELIDLKIAEHRGRIVKTTGDGLLVEFASVVDAIRCATEWQGAMTDRAQAPATRIDFRIGVNVGDIIIDEGDIFGDGVNIAARLEAMAKPGGICVSGAAHDQVRDKLDLLFEDIGEQQVKNIARPIHVYRIPQQAGAGVPDEASQAPLALPDKPSIAVLPFANMSGDPEQEYFADGMVEEIITALARIRWLFVIARNSSFTYKGKSVDVKQVGLELGVRYVLEGSVRKAGKRVRIAAQLIEAETGAHLWADHFDGSLEDVFDLQDLVAHSVSGIIEPALQAAEVHRSAGRPTTNLTAYDLYLRALEMAASLSKAGVLQALDLLERAIERDPRYGPALSLAARCHVRAFMDGWGEEPEIERRKGIDLGHRALSVARDDPVTIGNAAYVLGELGENIETMLALIDRSLAFNPSYAHGWFLSGALRVDAGEPDLGIEHVERALRLSPRDRSGAYFSVIGSAHFFAGRFEDAVPKLLMAIQEHPDHPWPFRFLASCYAHMGQLREAGDVVERLRAITPTVVPSHMPWRKPEHQDLLLSGLRMAMGEAT